MKYQNQITIKQIILAGITFGVIGIIFYLAFQTIYPFLGIFVTSGIFAIFLNPVYLKIKSQTGKVGLAAFLTVLLLLIFVIIPLAMLISSLFTEAVAVARLVQTNPDWLNSFQSNLDLRIATLPLPIEISDLNLKDQIYQSLAFVTKSLGSVALKTGGLILNLFFGLLTIFYLLTSQKQMVRYVDDLKLFPKRYLKLIYSRTVEIVNGTIRGYLLVVVLQLFIGVIGFLLFQIPLAVLLGSIYGLSSLLPIIGGLLLWVPVVIWQIALGNTVTAILLIVWFLGLSFLVENIIAPKIIGQNTKLHQLFVMFSVFGGIQYFGLVGMVLGPVVIALAFVAVTILKEIVSTNKVEQDRK